MCGWWLSRLFYCIVWFWFGSFFAKPCSACALWARSLSTEMDNVQQDEQCPPRWTKWGKLDHVEGRDPRGSSHIPKSESGHCVLREGQCPSRWTTSTKMDNVHQDGQYPSRWTIASKMDDVHRDGQKKRPSRRTFQPNLEKMFLHENHQKNDESKIRQQCNSFFWILSLEFLPKWKVIHFSSPTENPFWPNLEKTFLPRKSSKPRQKLNLTAR